MNKPWERQPGETAKAYAAFLHYRDLPAIDRSVAAARERQERDRKGTLRQWNGWSMRNGWVNRAAEHDSDLASRRRERVAKELERSKDDAVLLIRAALAKVAERIQGMDPEELAAETCHEENATQLITHVEVTPSSGSDIDVSVPVVDGLAERKVRPDELFADTAYGSSRNAFEASRRGTELVSPVAGSAPGNSHEGEGDGPPPLTAADFQIDVTGEQATVCPAGHPSIEEYELKDAPERVEVHFAGTTCEPCPLRSRCPVKLDRRAGAYVLKADLVKVNIERRRRAEATEEWRKRYDIRAGIEGTNSELKRAHGLGRLRVRGGRRVRLAVYLKALACNFKRMVHARLVEMENTAQRAVGTVPAVAAA